MKGPLIYALGLPLLIAGSSVAGAQEMEPGPPPEVVQPNGPMPEQQPPPPPEAYPQAYPPVQPQAAAPIAPAAGQWVYTSQYGWVWMPYGAGYTTEGAAGAPYSYVYYPRRGWTWLASPWVWGQGPYPYFGAVGPLHFAWYTRLHGSGYGWGHYPAAARPWYPPRAAYVRVSPGWSRGGYGRAWSAPHGTSSWRGGGYQSHGGGHQGHGGGHGGHRGHR